MKLGPGSGVVVIKAARAWFNRRELAEAAQRYQRAQSMKLPDAVKASALNDRIFGATNTGDCDSAAVALADAKRARDRTRPARDPTDGKAALCADPGPGCDGRSGAGR